MPLTPFHFGPALLLKGLVPRCFSLSTFIVVQIVIDVETLYHFLRHEWPLHRILHSVVGGTSIGIVVAVLVWWAGSALGSRTREVSFIATLSGGIVGGASHTLLDGLFHADLHPYWPFSTAPGWPDVISRGSLHLGCVIAGVLGCGILWLAERTRRDDARRDRPDETPSTPTHGPGG